MSTVLDSVLRDTLATVEALLLRLYIGATDPQSGRALGLRREDLKKALTVALDQAADAFVEPPVAPLDHAVAVEDERVAGPDL